MPYRDERRCHICGALTRQICPGCENAVCVEHTLASRVSGASVDERAQAERLARRIGGMDACERCVESEARASAGPFVEIMRSGDPIQTQMVVEALIDAGFDARALGTQNAALLGAGQHIFDQRIEVPEPQVEGALALVADLQAPSPLDEADEDGLWQQAEAAGGGDHEPGDADADDAEDADDDQDDDDKHEDEHDDDGETPRRTPRRPAIAAGLAFVFPGLGHYYAQHTWTGLLLTLTFAAGVVAAGRHFVLGVAVVAGTPVLDALVSPLAVSAYNRGAVRPAGFQVLVGGAMGALLFLLGWLAQRL